MGYNVAVVGENSGCKDSVEGIPAVEWVALGINLSNTECAQDCIAYCNDAESQDCCCLNVPGTDDEVCVVKPEALRGVTEDGSGGWGMDCTHDTDGSTAAGFTPGFTPDSDDLMSDSAEMEIAEEQMLGKINAQYWNRNYMVAGIFATAVCLGSLSVKLQKKFQTYNEQRITNEFKIMED